MDYGHTQGVQAHQAQHGPVEAVTLDQPADGEAHPLLFSPEVRRALVLALHAAASERRPWGGSWSETDKRAIKLFCLKKVLNKPTWTPEAPLSEPYSYAWTS